MVIRLLQTQSVYISTYFHYIVCFYLNIYLFLKRFSKNVKSMPVDIARLKY